MTGTATAPVIREQISDDAFQLRIDKYIFAGSVLIGTFILALPGLIPMWKAWQLHRQGVAQGRLLRPTTVTIIAICCLVDGFANYLIWGVDLLPTHDTVLGHTIYTGLGQFFDGAYNLGYNTTPLGGTAVPSEKALEFGGALVLYPMRVVATWGFMRMKKWGFQYLVVSTWLYVFFWIAYIGAFSYEFQWRFPHTEFGVSMLWLLYIWFIYPFFMIPYLATVNKRLWTE